MLDYVALISIFFLVIVGAAVIVFIRSMPGKIARRRGHPYPDAVNAASWIGPFLKSFEEYPPAQEPRSFTVGDAFKTIKAVPTQ